MEKTNPFSLGSATYAARRATDIIGTLQEFHGADPSQLVRSVNIVLRKYGETTQLHANELEDLQHAAAKLYEVFLAKNTAETATLLNSILREYAKTPRLTSHGQTSWHLHVDSSDHAPWAEWFAGSSALALATLLAEKQRNPGGVCASSPCKKPFIDTGKGGGREYCSPRCATRERVAAYRTMGKNS